MCQLKRLHALPFNPFYLDVCALQMLEVLEEARLPVMRLFNASEATGVLAAHAPAWAEAVRQGRTPGA